MEEDTGRDEGSKRRTRTYTHTHTRTCARARGRRLIICLSICLPAFIEKVERLTFIYLYV